MPKNNILKALEELDKQDIYSLILFTLYRLKDVSEYSVLSELVYILDEKSFSRFLSYFEGQTIKIPKIQDLKNIINALLFYERKSNTDLTDDEILSDLNVSEKEKDTLYETINLISEIIKEYDFKRSKDAVQYFNKD